MPPLNRPSRTKNLNRIPQELKDLSQWCVWKFEPSDKQDGKPKKVPYSVNGKYASSTDESTWSTYKEAEKLLKSGDYDGLMFALTSDDDLVFIDIDNCRNPKNNSLHRDVQKLRDEFSSYTETSVSGKGIHILVSGRKPGDRCRRGKYECYERDRFVALTGRVHRGLDVIQDRQDALDRFYRTCIQTEDDSSCVSVTAPIPEEKLEKLLSNPKSARIFDGNTTGYTSQSEADLALCRFAIDSGFTPGELPALLLQARDNAGAAEKHHTYFEITVRKVTGNAEAMTLPEAREVFDHYLHQPDSWGLDVVLSVVATAPLPGDPLWIHVVGPPSSGKTELITAVTDYPTLYPVSELTSAGLVSGADAEDGEDHSLMPKLDGKTLAIKDFTPTIDAPREQRQKLFGRLRDAYDGSQTVHTAMVGTRTHRARFNCITGVTNAIEVVARNTSLGERFLLYRQPSPSPEKVATAALEGATRKKEMRKDLSKAACGVLNGIDYDVVPSCDGDGKQVIQSLAIMLASARTHVERDHRHNIKTHPQPEGPARLVQQLHKLALGLALINRRQKVAPDDLKIVRRVTLDSIPSYRLRILEMLYSKPSKRWVALDDVVESCQFPKSTARERLADLLILGICREKKFKKGNRSIVKYRMTERFRKLLDVTSPRKNGTSHPPSA